MMEGEGEEVDELAGEEEEEGEGEGGEEEYVLEQEGLRIMSGESFSSPFSLERERVSLSLSFPTGLDSKADSLLLPVRRVPSLLPFLGSLLAAGFLDSHHPRPSSHQHVHDSEQEQPPAHSMASLADVFGRGGGEGGDRVGEEEGRES